MTERARRAVAELKAAAAALNGSANPIDVAVAAVLTAHARYWMQWFPADPSPTDVAVLALARAIVAEEEQDPEKGRKTRK